MKRTYVLVSVLFIVSCLSVASSALAGPAATGACCTDNSSWCSITTEADCTFWAFLGAVYAGDGTDCSSCFKRTSGACTARPGTIIIKDCWIVADDPTKGFMTPEANCLQFSSCCDTVYLGDGTCCPSGVCPPPVNTEPVPTVSEWGIAIMGLLLLVGGKVYFSRRRAMRA